MDNQPNPNEGSPVEFISEVGKGLSMVANLAEKAGAPPDVIKEFRDISDRYNSLVTNVQGGEPSQEPVNRAPEEVNSQPM